MKKPRYLLKTDGQGDIISVPNPDCYDNNGSFIKVRKKNTHLILKKKKRK